MQLTQGTSDKFYQQGQLLPENFLKAGRAAGYDEFQIRVRSQEGYDHSYYFVRIPPPKNYRYLLKKDLKVSTFASDHIHCKVQLSIFLPFFKQIAVHANFLKA